MINWIPQEERLPEEGLEVLIWLVALSWGWSARAKVASFAIDGQFYHDGEYSWKLEETSHWAYINPPESVYSVDEGSNIEREDSISYSIEVGND